MSFRAGDTVGDYKIVGIIGSGASGEVFKVEHTVTRRVEAMKILVDGRSSEAAQRFLREIKLHASLNHPNIASVYNAFWVEDDLVMVMELVDGDSLQRVLERRRLAVEDAIDYASQALSALSYAHACGVVHRDIKPANMIVTRDGTLKVTDFGIAKTAADPHMSQSGAVVGSSYYMAPEQVRGSDEVDARSDIYSMGAVLYEMCTGRKPFDGENSFQVMLAHVEKPPRPPVECAPALREVILTALAKKPSQRFRDADRFREALEAAKSAPAVEPVPEPEIPQPAAIAPPARRSRLYRIPSQAALVALVLAPLMVSQTGVRPSTLLRTPRAASRSSDVLADIKPVTAPPADSAAAPASEPAFSQPAPADDPLRQLASLPPPPIPPDNSRRASSKAHAKANPFPKSAFVPPPARPADRVSAVIPEPPPVHRAGPDVPLGVPGERAGQVLRDQPTAPKPPEQARKLPAKKTRGMLRKALGHILRPLRLDGDDSQKGRP